MQAGMLHSTVVCQVKALVTLALLVPGLARTYSLRYVMAMSVSAQNVEIVLTAHPTQVMKQHDWAALAPK